MITDDYGNRRFYGIYRGLVTENADPTNQGRVKLQVPQVLGDAITDWSWSKDSHGVHVDPPVIGQGVWVQFEGGDPSFPVWVGTFGEDPTTLNMAFDDLTDVTISSPTSRQVPVYNSVSGQWENSSVAIPAGGTAGQVLAKASNSDYLVSWVSGTQVPTSTVKHIVRNDHSATLPKGTVVYTSGANGTNILVKPAIATGDITSSQVVGFLEVDLAPNQDGYAISEGILSGVNTSGAAADGDPMWLSSTVAGGVLYGFANEPYAGKDGNPAHIVYLGVVTKKSGVGSSSGEIFVRISNGWELDELHNVNIDHANALAPNDILQYDSATSLWKNTSLGSNSLYVGTTQIVLNRASASQSLTGITSIDGSAATLTTSRTLWGQSFNGSANVTGDITSVGNITGAGAVTLASGTSSLLTISGTNGLTLNDGTGSLTVTGFGLGGLSSNASGVISSGTLAVGVGGTGATTFTSGAYLKGAGTSAITAQTGIPGGDITSGQVPAAYGGVPTGAIFQWVTASAPSGYLLCDGSNVSRNTYSTLFSVVGTSYGTGDGSTTFTLPNFQARVPIGVQAPVSLGTATITIAAPGVVTRAAHGLATGNIVYFTTTGALPTGLTATTGRYWAIVLSSSTFTLASSLANALAGTAITTSGTQSGTHTVFSSDFELGRSNGEKNHTLTSTEMPSHTHVQDSHNHTQNAHTHTSNAGEGSGSGATRDTASGGGDGYKATYFTPQLVINSTTATNIATTATNQNTGGSLPSNNLPQYLVTYYIMKT